VLVAVTGGGVGMAEAGHQLRSVAPVQAARVPAA
jgi:hypothetical protein